MRFLFKSASFACVMMLSLVGGGVPAQATTLEDALIRAYNTNPTLKASREELKVQDEEISEALSGARPTLSFDGQADWFRTDTDPGTVRSRDAQTMSVGITQPLYKGGQIDAAVSRAENRILGQREELRNTEQTVLLSAVEAYFNIIRDQAILSLNQKNVEVLTEQQEATQQGFEVGEFTRTDTSQASSRLERAKADRIEAENTLKTSIAVYNEVIGDYNPKPGLTTKSFSLDLPSTLDEATEVALVNNPAILSASFQKEASQHDVSFFEGELLPQIDLIGELKKSYEPSFALREQDQAVVGVGLTIPLYNGGASRSRIRAAKKTINQREEELNEVRREVQQLVISYWSDYVSAEAKLNAIQKQIDAAALALEGVQQEKQLGTRTVLDTLDAEQELLDAKVSYVQAERDLIVAKFAVLSAMGYLTAEKLGLEVPYYDPVPHYSETRSKWFSLE